MPGRLGLLVDDAPYGTIQAAEVIRHARGALAKGWQVVLAFLGDGVYTLLPGGSPPPREWVCLADAVGETIEEGGDRVRVLADVESLQARELSAGDLIPGVRPASLDDIAQAMAGCNRTLLF